MLDTIVGIIALAASAVMYLIYPNFSSIKYAKYVDFSKIIR